MNIIRKYIFLFLAFLAFLVATGLFLVSQQATNNSQNSYLSLVQERITQKIELADTEINQILQQAIGVKKNVFSHYAGASQLPYFVFKNKKLVYWSDYHFAPTYAAIQGNFRYKTINTEGSIWIANKRQGFLANDTLEVVSVFSLYRVYNSTNSNKFLEPAYNSDIFVTKPQGLFTKMRNTSQNISYKQQFLFSATSPNSDFLKNQRVPNNAIFFGVFGILFLGIWLLNHVRQLRKTRKYGSGFLWLLAYLVLLRIAMVYYNIPFTFNESSLFSSSLFYISSITPSLGDYLLNLLVFIILVFYWVNNYFRSNIYLWLIKLPKALQSGISISMVVLSFGILVWVYNGMAGIYLFSKYRLGFALNIGIFKEQTSIGALVAYILLAGIYFLCNHLLSSLFIRYFRTLKQGITWLSVGTIIAVICVALVAPKHWLLLLLHGFYFWAICLSRFPRSLYSFRYQTSIYLFVSALMAASIGTVTALEQEQQIMYDQQQRFGKKYLAQNDELGEFLLQKSVESIKKDSEILKLLNDPLLPREKVQLRIKKQHLELYFDQYNVDVQVFDNSGNSLDIDPNAQPLSTFKQLFQQAPNKTSYPNLYFLNTANQPKKYGQFISLWQADSTKLKGTLIIELQKRTENGSSASIFSDLMDTRIEQTPQPIAYSYAIFQQQKIVNSVGKFNYEKRFPKTLLANSMLFEKGIDTSEYRHLGLKNKDGQILIISAEQHLFAHIFSTFSFLYLLLVVVVIAVVVTFAIRYAFSRVNISFATKIQIYLNIAFLLPLILVVGITLSIIGNTLLSNQENNYLNLSRNVSSSIETTLEGYYNGKNSISYFVQELQKSARELGRDINVFDTSGQLIASSTETFYEKGVLSKLLNPRALAHILEDNEKELLLPETLGNLAYTGSFVGLKTSNGRILGVSNVPFYDSKSSFEKQVIEVIGSILSTFTSIFLLLLVLSYFASNILTVPLRLITQKIRRTNLDRYNEPVQWKSDDELGLLIGEYNKMLLKLEESKLALTMSEKQSAWREMAKQVAHEIKNPLTPMKLTLQQLQRTLPTNNAENPNSKRLIERALRSLIDQIDNISDIANSFSDFANMPVPKTELFDIVAVTSNAADLYADDANIILVEEIPTHQELYVIGDRQMMGRIITNLIINGIQAVPIGRQPEITIKLSHNNRQVVIGVTDNGTGIPEHIQQKIYMPNFSTKKEGSGVGLAVAKRGIDLAGGNIWFETQENKGTTFLLHLPLKSIKEK